MWKNRYIRKLSTLVILSMAQNVLLKIFLWNYNLNQKGYWKSSLELDLFKYRQSFNKQVHKKSNFVSFFLSYFYLNFRLFLTRFGGRMEVFSKSLQLRKNCLTLYISFTLCSSAHTMRAKGNQEWERQEVKWDLL